MRVTEAVTLFKLSVPTSHISAMIALVVAYIIIRIQFGKRQAGLYADAAFYFVVVWKGSYVLTHFGDFLKAPLSLLYYDGGLIGALAGLLVGLFFLIRHELLGAPAILVAAVTIQAIYQIMMVFLNDNGVSAEIVTVILFGGLLLLTIFRAGSSLLWQQQLTALFGAVHLIAAAVQPDGFGGLAFISTIIFCLFHYTLLKSGRHHHE